MVLSFLTANSELCSFTSSGGVNWENHHSSSSEWIQSLQVHFGLMPLDPTVHSDKLSFFSCSSLLSLTLPRSSAINCSKSTLTLTEQHDRHTYQLEDLCMFYSAALAGLLAFPSFTCFTQLKMLQIYLAKGLLVQGYIG